MAVYAEVNITVNPLEDHANLAWQTNFTGDLPWYRVYTTGESIQSSEDFQYKWTEVCFSHYHFYVPPNQPNYTFDFQLYCREGTAYVADDWEGLLILDVSDPSSPREVMLYETGQWTTTVVAFQDYLFVGDSQGLRIFDLTCM